MKKKKLIIFLNSLEPYKEKELNKIQYPESKLQPLKKEDMNLFELELEANFLQFLKKKDKNLFEQILKTNYDIIKDKNKGKDDIREAKLKLAECYYEMAGFYYLESKNKDGGLEICEDYLKTAKIIANEINDYFLVDRINIGLFFVSKKIKEKNRIKQDIEETKNNEENKNNIEIEFLNEVFHQKKYGCQCDKILYSSIMNEKTHQKKHTCPYLKLQSNIINEAYKLKIKEIEKLEPDILLLNSNPLKNYFSVLNSGIFAYHNNQYYLLEQMNKKITKNLNIESHLLNKENFQMALDKKGKILIIQSDDFTEKGEIILETDKGESELLSIEDLTKSNLLPEKIKFDILILCFIKSEKLIEIFKEKVNYLITFDNIDCFDLDGETLLKYNKLCIDFIINFVGKAFSEIKENTIEESFKNAKDIFINELKDYHLKTEYINLTKKSQIKFVKNKNQGKIILNNPLLDLPKKILCRDYADELFHLIDVILSGKYKYLNIYTTVSGINKKFIGIELIKFFHRHQSFNNIYYVDYTKKLGDSLDLITNNILPGAKKTNDSVKKTDKYETFILINNFFKNKEKEKEKEIKIKISSSLNDNNIQYLILSNDKINIECNSSIYQQSLENHSIKIKNNKKNKKKENDKANKDEPDILKDFESIFNYSFESGDNLSDQSDDFDNNLDNN